MRFVIAFGPGGVGDTTSRLVAEKLGEKLGQRVVIENNPGGGGIAAARAVLSAPADGHTLALLTNGTSISVSLFKNLTFNPLTDFAPVTKIGKFEFFFAANAASPYRSLADVLKAARDNPGKLNVGTVNPGSTQHLSALLLKSTAGIEFQWVPFRNSPDLLVALLRGDVDVGVDAYAAFRGNFDDGKLRPLATSAPMRSPLLPNVPTANEAGAGGFDVTAWNGLFVRTGTPPNRRPAQLGHARGVGRRGPQAAPAGDGHLADPTSPEELDDLLQGRHRQMGRRHRQNKIEQR